MHPNKSLPNDDQVRGELAGSDVDNNSGKSNNG